MALEDLLISTGVDQLIKLVKEKGKVELSAAAKELKQPVRTIEDWAHVLEEESLVEIEYKLTKIYLVWKGPTAQYVAEKSSRMGEKAEETKEEVTQLLTAVEQGGRDLAQMQDEMVKIGTAASITPDEAQRLREELGALSEKYSSVLSASAQKLDRLKKTLDALEPKATRAQAAGKEDAVGKLANELAALKNFEGTLQSQIEDTESFFGAFETRLEEFRKRIEDGRADEQLALLRTEIADAKSLKNELDSAMEAIVDEQKSMAQKIAAAEKHAQAFEEGEDSIGGAKKKLVELRKMGEDAKRQKEAIVESLKDTVSLVKKQAAKVSSLASGQKETLERMQHIKDDYVDISSEIASAQDEIRQKQSEVSKRLSESITALDAQKGGIRISKDELQKASFLLNEMKREQTMLEGKVRALLKESEILGLQPAEGTPSVAQTAPAAASSRAGGNAEFVERIKLSQEEEGEFERKREELRSLIRRMWEENKSDSP